MGFLKRLATGFWADVGQVEIYRFVRRISIDKRPVVMDGPTPRLMMREETQPMNLIDRQLSRFTEPMIPDRLVKQRVDIPPVSD